MPHTPITAALAHLIVRPARPSYQARTMRAEFVADDAIHGEVEARRRQVARARIETVFSAAARNAPGQPTSARIVFASLIALALGVGAVWH